MASPKLPQYMTYIERRKPQFKIHDTLGTVKSSIVYHVHKIVPGRFRQPLVEGADCDMVAYELDGNEYKVLWDVPKGTLDEELPWTVKRQKPYISVKAPNCSHVGCTCNSN